MIVFTRNRTILIAGVLLSLVLAVTVFVIRRIGSSYGQGLSEFENQSDGEYAQLIKTHRMKKIRISRTETPDCIEVTADGAVRIYETCEGELEDTYRASDMRTIQRLFTIVSRYGGSRTRGGADDTEITVEMDDGSLVTIFVPSDGGTGDTGLPDIIGEIVARPPTPSQQMAPTGYLPSPTPYVTGIATPAPTLPPGISPTPAPTADETSFTCDFYDSASTTKKPYRVSSVVCSTEPVAGQ
jgi:hypothetical protein